MVKSDKTVNFSSSNFERHAYTIDRKTNVKRAFFNYIPKLDLLELKEDIKDYVNKFIGIVDKDFLTPEEKFLKRLNSLFRLIDKPDTNMRNVLNFGGIVSTDNIRKPEVILGLSFYKYGDAATDMSGEARFQLKMELHTIEDKYDCAVEVDYTSGTAKYIMNQDFMVFLYKTQIKDISVYGEKTTYLDIFSYALDDTIYDLYEKIKNYKDDVGLKSNNNLSKSIHL